MSKEESRVLTYVVRLSGQARVFQSHMTAGTSVRSRSLNVSETNLFRYRVLVIIELKEVLPSFLSIGGILQIPILRVGSWIGVILVAFWFV